MVSICLYVFHLMKQAWHLKISATKCPDTRGDIHHTCLPHTLNLLFITKHTGAPTLLTIMGWNYYKIMSLSIAVLNSYLGDWPQTLQQHRPHLEIA
jgi:hypothetical protein